MQMHAQPGLNTQQFKHDLNTKVGTQVKKVKEVLRNFNFNDFNQILEKYK